ncbi:uncharacterized protein [Venturia canescens]|uniref:uncharacterized protein n=1 Tax=Venturia canescens TaxID=32260 RepID=UPI001C9CEF47|nr:uncharacterized protein LOC122415438 [Venturia canescens]
MALSARNQFAENTDQNVNASTLSSNDPVPEQLKEVVELMNSVNRRLEDCAVEWQSSVSRKQWRILDGKSGSDKSWEQSLLARTYFSNKSLDEAFQSLLLRDKTFTEQINNFVALLRGDDASLTALNVRDAQNQCPDTQTLDRPENKCPDVSPLDLTFLENHENVRKTRKSKRLAAGNGITSIQQSFGDLVKAKINLDTKFLGFEAILNGNRIPQKNKSSTCLCQICSNVLGSAVEKSNVMKSIASVRHKVQRVTRAQNKRLTRSAKTWSRAKKSKPESITLDQNGDEGTMITETSYRQPITD